MDFLLNVLYLIEIGERISDTLTREPDDDTD